MSQILGYDSKGNPIYPAVTGHIYTQAFILCDPCRSAIRNVGGPRHGSICPACASEGRFTSPEQAQALKQVRRAEGSRP